MDYNHKQRAITINAKQTLDKHGQTGGVPLRITGQTTANIQAKWAKLVTSYSSSAFSGRAGWPPRWPPKQPLWRHQSENVTYERGERRQNRQKRSHLGRGRRSSCGRGHGKNGKNPLPPRLPNGTNPGSPGAYRTTAEGCQKTPSMCRCPLRIE